MCFAFPHPTFQVLGAKHALGYHDLRSRCWVQNTTRIQNLSYRHLTPILFMIVVSGLKSIPCIRHLVLDVRRTCSRAAAPALVKPHRTCSLAAAPALLQPHLLSCSRICSRAAAPALLQLQLHFIAAALAALAALASAPAHYCSRSCFYRCWHTLLQPPLLL